MDLRHLADCIAIQDRITRTCTSIDERNWDAYIACYTADAKIGYPHRPPVQTPSEFTARAPELLRHFPMTQHVATNSTITVTGDTATSCVYITAYHGLVGRHLKDGPWYVAGATYSDALVRKNGVWLIQTRRCDLKWTDGDLASVQAKS